MNATPITTVPNRPAGKPVFDYQIAAGYARVALTTVSNNGAMLTVSGCAHQIDANGVPVLDANTGSPIRTSDGSNSILLSGIMADTHTLYNGWTKYMPPSGTTIGATDLPAGWTSGSGAPTGTPAYGTGYYDTTADQGWVYSEGMLPSIAAGYANALQTQIDTAAKLLALGL